MFKQTGHFACTIAGNIDFKPYSTPPGEPKGKSNARDRAQGCRQGRDLTEKVSVVGYGDPRLGVNKVVI